MSSKTIYELVFVMPDGSTILRGREGAAHAQASLIGYPVKQAVFGMRYFPSRKAWRVYDLRQVSLVATTYRRGLGSIRLKAPPSCFEHPDKDAAIMWSVLKLNG